MSRPNHAALLIQPPLSAHRTGGFRVRRGAVSAAELSTRDYRTSIRVCGFSYVKATSGSRCTKLSLA